MKVLVACEESQTVTKAFRRVGVEAYSCDIQECSGGHPEWHIQGDALEQAYSGEYDLMIAHPPCTYLSKAGARWMKPKGGMVCQVRFALAMQAKDFFMKLLDAPIPYVAVENPIPLKICGLPKCTQIVHPYQYGDPYSKTTLLWLKNLPELQSTNVVEPIGSWTELNRKVSKRSKTFNGIADAMVNQWLSFIGDSNGILS